MMHISGLKRGQGHLRNLRSCCLQGSLRCIKEYLSEKQNGYIYKVVVAYEKWSLWQSRQTVLKIGFYLQHIQLVKYGLVFQHACSKHWIKNIHRNLFHFISCGISALFLFINYLLRKHSFKFSENLENFPNKINL